MQSRKIGVLDTGVGGLYTLSKIRRRIPGALLVYIGDCRNLPHNIHPKEWICEKAQLLINFLLDQGVAELVIACHTISSLLPLLDTGTAVVYDIISPTLQCLRTRKQDEHSLFIGTRTTIESGCYQPDHLPAADATYIAAVELATRIERDGPDDPETVRYLDALLGQHLEGIPMEATTLTVFPVCTHYFLVRSHLVRFMTAHFPNVRTDFVEPSTLLAERLAGGEAGRNGHVELFLNQDQDAAFEVRLDQVFAQIGMEKERVRYVHLGT